LAKVEVGRELANRLDTICERDKHAAGALSYDGLVQSWPEIIRLARASAAAASAALTETFV
jgi:putative DNA methylase